MSRKPESLRAKALIGACVMAILAAGPAGAASDGFWIGGGSGGSGGSSHGDRGYDRDRNGPAHPREVEVDKLGGPYRTIAEGIRAAAGAASFASSPASMSNRSRFTARSPCSASSTSRVSFRCP